MSGYVRGGVQMPYKAAPLQTSATLNYASTSATAATPQQRAAAPAYNSRMAMMTLMDDYERWYTEPSPSNRMLLSLRSGIESEVEWALERLCRLSSNEHFTLASIPGLTDVLLEWPEWYVNEYGTRSTGKGKNKYLSLFSPSPSEARRRRHALEALFVLRNAAMSSPNSSELSAHSKSRPLFTRAILELELDSDENTQFISYSLDLLQCIGGSYILPSRSSGSSSESARLIRTLEQMANQSSDRAIIIGSLTVLATLLSLPQNSEYNSTSSQALSACIRFLPLFQDNALVDTCLNYLYTHLSHAPATRAFLAHSDMLNTVKLLVGYIVSQQVEKEETFEIQTTAHTVPAMRTKTVDCELTSEELERIGSLPEPERCFEWLRKLLVADPNEEITQVEFWNSYKDHFQRFQDRHPLLVASDVIKNASICYPTAQAAVLPGPPAKFIIRGISKRKKVVPIESYTCQWERSQCKGEDFKTPEDLYKHVQSHLDAIADESETNDVPCFWATCEHKASSKAALIPHIWTHAVIRSNAGGSKDKRPDELSQITLASSSEPFPIPDATKRPPPPPPVTVVSYTTPARDPSAGALTALLVLRTLFRASFVSKDVAPRADTDHFGFPGFVEEAEDHDSIADGGDDTEAESAEERRGRRAFADAKHLMECVHIKDPALMSWIYEMIDAVTDNPP